MFKDYFFVKEDDLWTATDSRSNLPVSQTLWAIHLRTWGTSVILWKDGKSRPMTVNNLPREIRTMLMVMGVVL